jgi:hypothetical protein
MSLYPKLDDDSLPNTPIGNQPQSPSPPTDNKSKTNNNDTDIPDYSGEPGPTEQRRCQDISFLILFIAFWVGMFVIAGVAGKEGNLNRFVLCG